MQNLEQLKQTISRLAELERESRVRSPDFYSGDVAGIEATHHQISTELRQIVDDWNWPGLSLLPWDSAKQALDLACACWSEPKFMRGLIPQLEAAFRFGDIPGDWFARYYDTIMFLENKPQVYGTVVDWSFNGTYDFWNIVEPEKVKFRRDAILMEDLQQYLNRMREEAALQSLPAPRDIAEFRVARAAWLEKRGWSRRADSK